jgi:hypothetical protein
VIEPEDWAEQRPGLIAEREASEAEVARVRKHSTELAQATPTLDAESELLRHLAGPRTAVLDGIGKAPNLDATRTLLRWLFKRVLDLAPDQPWLQMEGFISDDMPQVGGGYLLPDLNPGVVEWVDGNGAPYSTDGAIQPYDPNEPEPIPGAHKARAAARG